MKPTGEWLEWEQLWQADRTSPERLEELIERTRRARLSLRLKRRLSTVVAVVALAVVGAALRHAGNAFEVTLGLVVGVGIVAVWLMDLANQRDATAKVDAPLEDYVAMRRALCVRQDRFARLGVDRHGARSRVSRSVVDRAGCQSTGGLLFDASAHRVGTTGAHERLRVVDDPVAAQGACGARAVGGCEVEVKPVIR